MGTTVTFRLILQPDWAVVADAIGGGPVLVRDGVPVYRANEAFTISQIAPRNPRSAVGQLADGGILLVVVDGRQSGYSVGMTNFEMAQTLVRLGAVRGMGLDSGGSSTLAFEGAVLNRPSDGQGSGRSRPRSCCSTSVSMHPRRAETVVSPNGDGVGEEQALAYKVVRPSNVDATLTAPDGSVACQEIRRARARGLRRRVPALPAAASAARGAPAPPRPTRLRPRRGTLDAVGLLDRRPGAAVDGDAAVLGQLDARLPPRSSRHGSCFRRAGDARRSAGRRRARRAFG